MAAVEYLLLFGLMSSALVAAVVLMGGEMSATWESWAYWLSSAESNLRPR